MSTPRIKTCSRPFSIVLAMRPPPFVRMSSRPVGAPSSRAVVSGPAPRQAGAPASFPPRHAPQPPRHHATHVARRSPPSAALPFRPRGRPACSRRARRSPGTRAWRGRPRSSRGSCAPAPRRLLGFGGGLVSPHVLQDLVAREHGTRVGRQKLQQLELARRTAAPPRHAGAPRTRRTAPPSRPPGTSAPRCAAGPPAPSPPPLSRSRRRRCACRRSESSSGWNGLTR